MSQQFSGNPALMVAAVLLTIIFVFLNFIKTCLRIQALTNHVAVLYDTTKVNTYIYSAR